jgi:hypothetical protein
MVLLTMDPGVMSSRVLERPERAGTDWVQGMIDFSGSRDQVIAAAVASQERRREVMARTQIPTLVIDTTGMEWTRYASQVIRFWGSRRVTYELGLRLRGNGRGGGLVGLAQEQDPVPHTQASRGSRSLAGGIAAPDQSPCFWEHHLSPIGREGEPRIMFDALGDDGWASPTPGQ